MPRDTMIRRQLYLTPNEILLLKRLAERTGLTASEHIRRAIDRYLKEQANTLLPKKVVNAR